MFLLFIVSNQTRDLVLHYKNEKILLDFVSILSYDGLLREKEAPKTWKKAKA